MSFQNVEDWLRALGLLHYAQAFYDNGYDTLEICKQITLDDLNVIGIKNEKDRTDIEVGVHQLGRDVLYFELVPEDGQPAANEIVVERKKFDEVKLKSIIKEELENRAVQLTEPPYFYPDGTFGDLFGLAVSISTKLETYAEDVFTALEQMQKRQLPSAVFEEEEEDAHPQEYLNVENPQAPSRTFSMSKYDKRVTKSTTDLHAATTDGSTSDLSSKFNKKRYNKGGNKQAFGQKILQSFRKKTPTNSKEGKDVQRHLMGGSTTPTGKDSLSSANSSPEMSRKKNKKQKKSRDEGAKELRRDKRSGSATFYTGEEGTFKALLSEKLSDDSTVSEDSRSISDAIPEECEFKANTLPGDSALGIKHQSNLIEKVRNSFRKGAKTTDENKDSNNDPQSSSSCNSSPGSIRVGEKIDSSGCASIQIKVPTVSPVNGQVMKAGTDKPFRTAPAPPLEKQKSLPFDDDRSPANKPVKKLSLGSNVSNRIQVLPPLFPPGGRKEPGSHAHRPAPPPRKDRSTSDPVTPTGVSPGNTPFYHGTRTAPTSEENIATIPTKELPRAPPRHRISKDLTDGGLSSPNSTPDVTPPDASPDVMSGSGRLKPRVRPLLPPRPPKTDKALNAVKQLTLLEQAKLDSGAPKKEVEIATLPEGKKLLKAKPLRSLLKTKLKRESVDLSDEPYTLSDGSWHIPPTMVERYAEELDKEENDVVETLDDIRKELRSNRGKAFVPVESRSVTEKKTVDRSWSIRDFLFEIGLPMFCNDLYEAGVDSMSELVALEEEDLKDVGVYESRHVHRLLLELKKVKLN